MIDTEVQKLRSLLVDYINKVQASDATIQKLEDFVAKLMDRNHQLQVIADEMCAEIQLWMESVNADQESQDIINRYKALTAKPNPVNDAQQVFDL
jgi:uncharacterized membrane-anchored protein YjiN (DUF445 family)